MTLLAVEGLAVDLGGFRLEDVTFTVPGGAIAGLVGPNGAGKTTLLSCVAGLRKADRGTVTAGPGGISFIDESPALFAGVTVAEHLRFVELACRIRDHGARDDLVERFGLGPHLGKVPGKLSLGTSRKTALAMGLLRRSDVLVLDEPLNGLDPDAQRELRMLVEGVRDAGQTVVVSSHWLPELERVAGTYLVLDGGRLLGSGTLAELRATSGAGAAAGLEDVYFAVLGRQVAS